MLSDPARQQLIAIVRSSLHAALEGAVYEVPGPDPALPELELLAGAFVTLKTDSHLRGCLGCFTSDDPLRVTVARMTRDSATQDPRFVHKRLTMADWDRIDFDVSVLSPLEPCSDPMSITPGVHGIYVRHGMRSGCFLPQVATEQNWSVEEFWSYCCAHKAGLAPDAWRTGDAELLTFAAEVVEGSAS